MTAVGSGIGAATGNNNGHSTIGRQGIYVNPVSGNNGTVGTGHQNGYGSTSLRHDTMVTANIGVSGTNAAPENRSTN